MTRSQGPTTTPGIDHALARHLRQQMALIRRFEENVSAVGSGNNASSGERAPLRGGKSDPAGVDADGGARHVGSLEPPMSALKEDRSRPPVDQLPTDATKTVTAVATGAHAGA
jgi:hypothetical protein